MILAGVGLEPEIICQDASGYILKRDSTLLFQLAVFAEIPRELHPRSVLHCSPLGKCVQFKEIKQAEREKAKAVAA